MLNILSLHFFIVFTKYVITVDIKKTTPLGPILLSVLERCRLVWMCVIFLHTLFRDENSCRLYADVRCMKVSVNGGSPVSSFAALHL